MSPPIRNWREKRTEHDFYKEIVTDITTLNSERKTRDWTTQKTKI